MYLNMGIDKWSHEIIYVDGMIHRLPECSFIRILFTQHILGINILDIDLKLIRVECH